MRRAVRRTACRAAYGVPCGVRRAVRRAACGVRAFASNPLLPLHLLRCVVSAAHCIVRAGCRYLQRAMVRRARVQTDGGVLSISGGSATFESVAISDTNAVVRAAWEADRAGGG
jgi:hypothetical protein